MTTFIEDAFFVLVCVFGLFIKNQVYIYIKIYVRAFNSIPLSNIYLMSILYSFYYYSIVVLLEIKETLELAEIINEMYLTDIYRIFYSKIKEYTFFELHGTFYKLGHILKNKEIFNKIQEK